MIAEEAYALSKSFTNNSIKGITGALAGKNCTIKSATKTDGVTTVVFAWTADDGTEKTTTIQVNDGVDGKDTSQEAVLFIEQKLDDAQKAQARENIGAADAARQNILMGSEIGNPIVVDDAFSAPLYGLTLYGKSTQVSTTGAQLFDKSKAFSGWVNSDGSIKNEGAVGKGDNIVSGYIPFEAGKQYYCRSVFVWIYNTEKGFVKKADTELKGEVFTSPDNAGFFVVAFSISAEEALAKLNEIMINVGSVRKPYEPYTGGKPSPSPSYPQEIENAGMDGEIGIEVLGGNLFDKSAADNLTQSGGWSASFDGEELKVVGNNITIGSIRLFNYKKTLPAGTYTFSISKPLPFKIRIDNYFLIKKGDTSATVTFDNGVSMSHFAVDAEPGATFNEQRFKIMLNAGSTALPYEPYKPAQTLIVPTPNGLPGIPVSSGGNYTDEKGQQWVCDEIDLEKGERVQWIGKTVVDGKKVKFVASSNSVYWNLPPGTSPGIIDGGTCISRYFAERAFAGNKKYGFAWTSSERMKPYFDTLKELNAFCVQKNSEGNPLTIYYCIETPIRTPLSSEVIAAYKALRTYSPTTTVINDAGAGTQLDYQRDVNISIKKLEDAIASMTTT